MHRQGLIWEVNNPTSSTKKMVSLVLGSLKPDHKKSNSYALASMLTPYFEKNDYVVEELVLSTKVIDAGITIKVDNPEDEFEEFLDTLFESDIIIFATPIWWNEASSLIQRVIERLDSVDEIQLAGKKHPFTGKSFGVVVSGAEDGSQSIVSRLNGWASFLGLTCPPFNSVTYLGDPKEVENDKSFLVMVEGTASNLMKAAELDVDWADWSRGF